MSDELEIQFIPDENKILIVDDVLSNVLLLKGQLKNEKYQIVTASNGFEAIEMVQKENPDLILLDVMMPGKSGFEVAEELKASNEYNHIPIIFLTALNSTNDIVRGFKLGASDFITKPFNKDELLIRVHHQISLVVAHRIIMEKTEELRRTIIGRDKLYSVIAHDLRSPMGSIKMVLNMLVLNIGDSMIGKELYEMLSLANKTTEDTFELLDNLLKWTKSQVGHLSVALQRMNIFDVLLDSLNIFEMGAKMKGITISQQTDTKCRETIDVYADIDLVKTILRNLISNAIKFTKSGGEINVLISESDDFVIINIKDNGSGIPIEDQKRLFKTEEHVSTFGTNNEEGSGLGLLLCKDFAIRNGGDLWFESEVGKGSTFSFSIPKYKEVAAAEKN